MVPEGASWHPNHQYAVDLGNAGVVWSTANALSLNLNYPIIKKIAVQKYFDIPIISSTLVEVRISVGPLERRVHAIRNALPIRGEFRISALHRRSLRGIEPPELAAFEEVYFTVSAPHHRGVQVVGDTFESF